MATSVHVHSSVIATPFTMSKSGKATDVSSSTNGVIGKKRKSTANNTLVLSDGSTFSILTDPVPVPEHCTQELVQLLVNRIKELSAPKKRAKKAPAKKAAPKKATAKKTVAKKAPAKKETV